MSATSEKRFLGVNWRSLLSEVRKPWQHACRWPFVVALTPRASVRLWQVGGEQSVWLVDANGEMRKVSANDHARFVAIELPEEMLLRRSITVPSLNDIEIRQAIEIEVQSNNPFQAEDLRWGYKVIDLAAQGMRRVDAVLSSHRQISSLIVANAGCFQGHGGAPEVWAKVDSHHYIFLEGYSEGARVRFGAGGRRLGYALLAFAVALVAAIAITPTLQLRAQAIEAVNAYTDAQYRAEPLMRQREALMRTAEQIDALRELAEGQADPLYVIDFLTRTLPDDTFLRSLQVRGLKVSLDGQTANAAALMQLLGAQPGLRDVVAPTAATRPFGSAKDNFKIEFVQVSPPSVVSAESPPSLSPLSAASAPAAEPLAPVVGIGETKKSTSEAPVLAASQHGQQPGPASQPRRSPFTTGP